MHGFLFSFSQRLPFPLYNLFSQWQLARSIQYINQVAAAAKSLQSCLTLCNPTDGSPPGSPIPGILQARILEWVAISFSRLQSPLLHPSNSALIRSGWMSSLYQRWRDATWSSSGHLSQAISHPSPGCGVQHSEPQPPMLLPQASAFPVSSAWNVLWMTARLNH